MLRTIFCLMLGSATIISCTEEVVDSPDITTANDSIPLAEGTWRFALDIGEATLPFNAELKFDDDKYTIDVINSEERIEVKEIAIQEDSITIRMPFFNSAFKGKILSDSLITGNWINYNRTDYAIPFTATHDETFRFVQKNNSKATDIAGKWEVMFSPDSEEDAYKAIGKFSQDGNIVSGTFITETGDYRFLEGIAVNDSLYLSCFDGAHAFLFKAALDADGKLNGTFWSGKHWSEPWTGFRNEDVMLRDPDSLTYLKPEYDRFTFEFPDLDSNMVSLDDARFRGKVVIVQIMGSWCPNCMDETALYSDLYNDLNPQGLEVVSLAFEASENFDVARKSVLRLKNDLDIPYPMLIAGVASKQKAAEALPMLNHVMSYPTSIFIDRNGEIRKIHTGFYGPGTGDYYDAYVKELEALLQDMLAKEVK